MKRYSYVNGEFVLHEAAMVSIEDRGYQFADGVYEVVLAKNGELIEWEPHYKRLQYSLAGLHINDTHTAAELEAIIQALLVKNKYRNRDALVYLQITRGVTARCHGLPSGDIKTTCVVTVTPEKPLPKAFYEKGIKLKTCRDLRWKRRDFKTIALFPNALAKTEALDAGAEEALLVEDNGAVTEGSSSNFFWIDGDARLWTPPANEMILNGITRQIVIELAIKAGIQVLEQSFELTTCLHAAKEAFITSTSKKVLPVFMIDEKNLSEVGHTTRLLMAAYEDYIIELTK